VSPRAPEDSLRPRLCSGAGARPLNFAVRGPVAVRFLQSLVVIASLGAADPSFSADVRVTGTFSSLRYNSEGGDLLGLEILIIPAPGDKVGYIALVQVAEGGAPYSALVPVTVTGTHIEFTFPRDGPYNGMKFSGTVSATDLTGTWSTGNREVLKRGRSYWD
jgi:hypothetical protein